MIHNLDLDNLPGDGVPGRTRRAGAGATPAKFVSVMVETGSSESSAQACEWVISSGGGCWQFKRVFVGVEINTTLASLTTFFETFAPEVVYAESNMARLELQNFEQPTELGNGDQLWGLDRIDSVIGESGGGRDGSFTTYPSLGEGVRIYLLDTGVDCEHPEFGPDGEIGRMQRNCEFGAEYSRNLYS